MHRSNEEQVEAGAWVIAALRIASRELKEKYPSLIKSETSQAEYPFSPSFIRKGGKGGETARVRFTYTQEDDRNALREKKVFHARVDGISRLRRGIPKLRTKLVFELEIAPDLLGVERIGKWYMVVMEDLSEHYISLHRVKMAVYDQRSAEKLVKEAVEPLNRKGFVHGDVGDTNIMINKEVVKGVRNRSHSSIGTGPGPMAR